MKIRKEYLILIFLIIILGIYLWRHNTNGINYQLPKLQEINKEAISRLELSRSNSGISLESRDGDWYIPQKDFRANKEKVQKILDTISQVEPSALISKSGNFERYKLGNEQSLAIKAYDDSKQLLREIGIGKSASSFQNNYVRLKDDPRVYLAKTPLSRDFAISAESLREKTVLSFSRKEIDSLTLENSGLIKIKRKQEQHGDNQAETTYWEDESGKRLDKNKVDDLLDQLLDLQCTSFYQKDAEKQMTSFDFKVTLQGDEKHILRLYVEKEKEQEIYKGRSSYTDHPFKLNNYKGKKILDSVKALLEK